MWDATQHDDENEFAFEYVAFEMLMVHPSKMSYKNLS